MIREIIIPDGTFTFREGHEEGCIACATGMKHEDFDKFKESYIKDLKKIYDSSEGYISRFLKGLLENYSKEELALMCQNLLFTKLDEAESSNNPLDSLLKNILDI